MAVPVPAKNNTWDKLCPRGHPKTLRFSYFGYKSSPFNFAINPNVEHGHLLLKSDAVKAGFCNTPSIGAMAVTIIKTKEVPLDAFAVKPLERLVFD